MSNKPAIPDELVTLGVPELSAILGRAPKTIQGYLSREPDQLPPSILIGGARRWRKSTVLAWLASRESAEHQQSPAGRTRQAAIRRRNLEAAARRKARRAPGESQ